MAINIPGLVGLVFFYLVILAIGLWVGRKKSVPQLDEHGVLISEETQIMLAGRNIGMFVGACTMTATWVGGGYINGTSEVIYSSGLLWCHAPFGYAISLLIGGFLFASKMRKAGYTTMLDPFQQHFGARMGGLLFLPALCGEIFWSAAILSALGATVEVIMDIDRRQSVIASACIALFYTFMGGLYSVAYTDVAQLAAIFFGLWLCVPFAFFHSTVGPISFPRNDYIGTVDWKKDWGVFGDSMLLLMMGGIPWQVYFQRVLASRTAEGAELLSYVAAVGCLLMAVPPVVIGAIAKAANFTIAGYTGPLPLTTEAVSLTLPLVLQYLTPGFMSAVGLGAVAAAVMSSADSSVLSAASMFAWNIYRMAIRPKASDTEVVWVLRAAIVVTGILATALALTAKSVYALWYLSSDLVYVILFPQLLSVVYFPGYVNTYGSLAAYTVGIVFRAGGGEPILGIPPFIHYPFYDEDEGVQRFPFRTLCMVMSLATLVLVSILSKSLLSGLLPPSADVLRCFTPAPEEAKSIAFLPEKPGVLPTEEQPPASSDQNAPPSVSGTTEKVLNSISAAEGRVGSRPSSEHLAATSSLDLEKHHIQSASGPDHNREGALIPETESRKTDMQTFGERNPEKPESSSPEYRRTEDRPEQPSSSATAEHPQPKSAREADGRQEGESSSNKN